MLLTEEEAKTKWCPFARYQHNQEPASNRWNQNAPPKEPHALNPIPCRCIASDCMAWRWVPRNSPMTAPSDPRRGYCGLAGKVEP